MIRKEVQKEKRVALFGLLGEREERTMWAVVQKKEKERRKRESRKREKKEAERVKEEEKLKKKGVVEEEANSEEVVMKEEEMKKELIEPQSNVDVDAPPPLVEEEIENPWGAGIPLEARRGRRR